jgi:hypothetical protein
VPAVAFVDDDPMGDHADHAQASAVLGVLVLALDLRGGAGASVAVTDSAMACASLHV